MLYFGYMANKKLPSITDSELLDIDVRFLLANERTLLAWVRTALAVIAGGVAVAQLGQHDTQHSALGTVVVLLGASMAWIGYLRYKEANVAIRNGRLPEYGHGPKLQVGVVLCFAAFVVAFDIFIR